MLTQERLKQLLSYDPETGLWTRLITIGGEKAGSVVTNKNGNGYIHFSIDRAKYLGHRLAWLYMTGEWPVGEIDHKDRDRANNRWSNLREATKSQNRANGEVPASNILGVKGVYLLKRPLTNPYRARIKVAGRYIHLGCFPTVEAASAAYAAAAQLHFGEFARVA